MKVVVVVTPFSADRREELPQPPATLRAEIGDTLVIDQAGTAAKPRIGEIIAVPNPDGSPPYLVRWLAGEYESMITPGPTARVEKRHAGHSASPK